MMTSIQGRLYTVTSIQGILYTPTDIQGIVDRVHTVALEDGFGHKLKHPLDNTSAGTRRHWLGEKEHQLSF